MQPMAASARLCHCFMGKAPCRSIGAYLQRIHQPLLVREHSALATGQDRPYYALHE